MAAKYAQNQTLSADRAAVNKQAPQNEAQDIAFGVQSGSTEIFNHVDENKPMWSGDGDREVRLTIPFDAPFSEPPHVMIGLSGIDSSHAQNLRINLLTTDVTQESFTVICTTWSDTKIARASVTWTALGDIQKQVKSHIAPNPFNKRRALRDVPTRES